MAVGCNGSLPVRPPRVHIGTFDGGAAPPYWCSEATPMIQDNRLAASTTSSPTLVFRGSSCASSNDQSPIRSIFPTYDTSFPLSQDRHLQDAKLVLRREKASGARATRMDYSPSLYSRPGSIATRHPTGPAPSTTVTEHFPGRVSTSEELLDLWALASGRDGGCSTDTFRLMLLCHNLSLFRESISFAASESYPVYTLSFTKAENGSTVDYPMLVSRSHPLNVNIETTVSLVQFQDPNVPSTGEIAKIFPCHAELVALDQSSSIAVEHSLPRSASKDLEQEAVARAKERETSSLLFDSDSSYTLVHPTLAHGDPAAFPIEAHPLQRPSMIRILSPYELDNSALLSLDLTTKQIEINSHLIAKLPSIYAMDTLISAMLCLLLHLQRSTSTLEPYFPYLPSQQASSTAFYPPPRSSFHESSWRSKGTKQKSMWLNLRANNAPDLELQEKVWTEPKLNLSHFYPFSSEDQRLATGTRTCLGLLYWCFEALVWIMGSFVGILAAGIVTVAGCVTNP